MINRFLTIIICCISLNTALGQDSTKNAIKFSSEISTLFKGDGIDISKIGYERYFASHNSLTLWVGYEFSSTNLIINNKESVVNSQNITSELEYRYYVGKNIKHTGVYVSCSGNYSTSMSNQDNERNQSYGSDFGVGYAHKINRFIIDIIVYKGYTYAVLKNNNMKYISSTINNFCYELSVAYTF